MNLYLRPKTVDEAVSMLAQSGGTILSGGTDFFPALGDQPPREAVVDISGVRDLRDITCTADEHRIGGLATWTEIISSPLPPCFNALKSAAREIGGVQIQNRGTIAGNLCNASPAADSVPPLLALDAEVELVSNAGSRRIPLSQFIVGNRKTARRTDEIVTAVLVSRSMDDAKSVFLKLGARRYLVISIAMVAVVIKTDARESIAEARVAVGSCSVAARRLSELEKTLPGLFLKPGVSSALRPEHFSPLAPIDDIRANAAYRLDAAMTLVSRALETCAGGR